MRVKTVEKSWRSKRKGGRRGLQLEGHPVEILKEVHSGCDDYMIEEREREECGNRGCETIEAEEWMCFFV